MKSLEDPRIGHWHHKPAVAYWTLWADLQTRLRLLGEMGEVRGNLALWFLKRSLTWVLLLGIWLGLASLHATAAGFLVQMTGSFTFSPASLTIGQGDSVTWTNISGSVHTSTSGSPPSSNGLWASPTETSGETFTVTFTNFAPNSYPYFCTFHYSFGMVGSIMVTNSATTAPATLKNPVWNSGEFQFAVNGTSGSTYVTERSQDLSNWFPVSTNVAPADQFVVTDPSAASRPSSGFYRVRSGL
jgi:plastocyanin